MWRCCENSDTHTRQIYFFNSIVYMVAQKAPGVLYLVLFTANTEKNCSQNDKLLHIFTMYSDLCLIPAQQNKTRRGTLSGFNMVICHLTLTLFFWSEIVIMTFLLVWPTWTLPQEQIDVWIVFVELQQLNCPTVSGWDRKYNHGRVPCCGWFCCFFSWMGQLFTAQPLGFNNTFPFKAPLQGCIRGKGKHFSSLVSFSGPFWIKL